MLFYDGRLADSTAVWRAEEVESSTIETWQRPYRRE